MNRNTKIVLGIVVGIIVSCMCICVGGIAGFRMVENALSRNMIVDEPEKAREVAQSIAEYDLPAGYTEKDVLNLFVFKEVFIGPIQKDPSQPIIMLIQASEAMEGDDEDIRLQLKEGMQSYRNLKFVEKKQAVIRGQATSLAVYEGVDDTGTPTRQVISGAVKGKEGIIVLVIVGPVQSWKQEMIDEFVKSIR